MLFITIFGAIFIHSAYSQAAQYSRNFGECVTPSNERSVCVFLNECGDLYNLLKRYNTLRREEDKIYLAQSQCGYQSNSILVCCPPRSPSRYPPAPSQPIGATPNSYLNQGGGGTESRVGESLLPQPGSCGIGSSDKIFGGNITKIYEFPWMCLLEYSKQILFPTERTETTQYSRIFGECLTPRNERSVCVFLSECGDLYSILRRVPLREDDKIYLRRSQCGKNENSILVCCPPRSPSRYPPTPSQSIRPTPNSYMNQGGGGTESKIGESLLPQPGVCGIGSSDKIYGGNITKIDEFPWMCLLEYSKPNNGKGFHCGGSLITNRYVVTASHCIKGKAIPLNWRLTSVRLGEWDTASDNDCDNGDCSEPTQDVAIERAITHEQYNPNSKAQYNDIALLRLVRNVVFTDWIKPICLPTANELRDTSFEEISLEVAGWGRTERGTSSRFKLKARVNGVPLQNCNQVYVRQNVELISSQMCAGGEAGIDSCSGDSGGPLIGFNIKNKDRPYFFLAGVVSFGPSACGLQDWPGVYTRTGHYIEWIESHLSP